MVQSVITHPEYYIYFSGIVLDTYIFNLFKSRVGNETNANYDRHMHDLIVNKTIHTEVLNKGKQNYQHFFLIP